MIGHLFASLVIEYTVFTLITDNMINILTIDHANRISVTQNSVPMNTVLMSKQTGCARRASEGNPECRRIAESKPRTLQGSDYAHAVQAEQGD